MVEVADAVILAAGYGKGLEPLTYTKHKVLMPILNKTLLYHHLEILRKLNVKRVILVVSYLKDQVIKYLRSLEKEIPKRPVDVLVVDEGKPLGTAHALLKGYEYVRSKEFLVIYGDVYIELEDIRSIFDVKGNVITTYRVSDDPRKYGVVIMDNGNVKRIVEKPKEIISRNVNAGVYKLTSDFIKYVEKVKLSERGEYELTDAINMAIEEGLIIKSLSLNYWLDVGRPWKLLELNRYLLHKVKESSIKGKVESGAILKGTVILSEGSEVLSGSYIVGPVFIDTNVVIGPNAYIRPYTVILSGAKIGFNVEVKESIVMEDTHISHQAYVGDSIVGEQCNLGAGTILANLRFDEASVKVTVKGVREDSGRKKLGAIVGGFVKTGVNVSICPGVKVGSYSWIYPGVTICRDVPPCTIVKSDGSLSELRGCPVKGYD